MEGDEEGASLSQLQRRLYEMDGNISQANTLVDVHLTIKAADSQAENDVPFICLTCESYDKAILGYPIQVTELSSEALVPCNKSSLANMGKKATFHQLSWKTSRRTPVCYMGSSVSRPNSKRSANEEDARVQNAAMMPKNVAIDFYVGGKAESGKACIPVEIVFARILSGLQ